MPEEQTVIEINLGLRAVTSLLLSTCRRLIAFRFAYSKGLFSSFHIDPASLAIQAIWTADNFARFNWNPFIRLELGERKPIVFSRANQSTKVFAEACVCVCGDSLCEFLTFSRSVDVSGAR